MQTITSTELAKLIDTSLDSLDLIDVRWTGEFEESHIAHSRNIPLHILPMRINEIDSNKQVIFICRSGGRSGQACQFAMKSNIQSYNLVGGILSYEDEFPAQIIHGAKKKLFWIF